MKDEYQAIVPQLTVRRATDAIAFYKAAFDAHELFRNESPDGAGIMHSELLLNGARIFVHDEFLDHGVAGPQSLGGSPVTLHLYVPDVDSAYARAVNAGAAATLPVQDAFWGERYGIVTDPFGHRWSIATPNDALAPSDVKARAAAWAAQEHQRTQGERQ